MARVSMVVGVICALSFGAAHAQGPGGCGAGQGSSISGGSLAATRVRMLPPMTGSVLTSPGSLAYDVMASQMVAQRVAQQQYMLAQQREQARQEKRTSMRERAEKLRAQTVEIRQRTRAELAAKNGRAPATQVSGSLAVRLPGQR